MEYEVKARTLHFRRPAGTSRGVYTIRQVWYVTFMEDGYSGTGECAPLPDLSCDAMPAAEYEFQLHRFCKLTCLTGCVDVETLRPYPSILFGVECALHKLYAAQRGEEPFSISEGIPINGLIWMGTYGEMKERLEEKLAAGFRCIKLKIGAISFEEELSLLSRIREEYPQEKVEIRVDANGAFSPQDVTDKLRQLTALKIHSIEQPIRAHQWEDMAQLCQYARQRLILPIALDEELIGIHTRAEKEQLLDAIHPQYIILKPSLHGGISGCNEWIRLAEEREIGWWATSALESNVGLADIARWVASYHPTMPQGLGTGLLFSDNTPPETEIRGDELFFIENV